MRNMIDRRAAVPPPAPRPTHFKKQNNYMASGGGREGEGVGGDSFADGKSLRTSNGFPLFGELVV